jgi:hypothetical protein
MRLAHQDPSVAAALAGVRPGSARSRSMCRLTAASRTAFSEYRAPLVALLRRASGERHEAAEVAQDAFAEFVEEELNLRGRSIDSGAEQRAEQRGGRMTRLLERRLDVNQRKAAGGTPLGLGAESGGVRNLSQCLSLRSACAA